jgi:hypothetical protein
MGTGPQTQNLSSLAIYKTTGEQNRCQQIRANLTNLFFPNRNNTKELFFLLRIHVGTLDTAQCVTYKNYNLYSNGINTTTRFYYY